MLKRVISIVIMFISLFQVNAQSTKNEQDVKTKMDAFVSKTGVIIKFIDIRLPNLKTTFDVAQTRIRKIGNGSAYSYFYQIENKGDYNNTVASIEHTDLLEVLKALTVLKNEVEKDKALDPDYLENKFITEDGFQVGYYISKGKATWYIRLKNYGSDSNLYMSDVDGIETSFTNAKQKIEELKK